MSKKSQKQEDDTDLEDFFDVPKLKKPLTLKDLKRIEEESYDLP